MTTRRAMIDDDDVLRLRAEGLTYQAIATLAGVTRQGVHARLRQLQQRRESFKTLAETPVLATGPEADSATPLRAYRGLMSARAWNALAFWFGADREPTVGDVRMLAKGLLRIQNFGARSYKEICALFGMACEDSSHAVLKAYAQFSKLERRREREEAQLEWEERRARFRSSEP